MYRPRPSSIALCDLAGSLRNPGTVLQYAVVFVVVHVLQFLVRRCYEAGVELIKLISVVLEVGHARGANTRFTVLSRRYKVGGVGHRLLR